MFNTIFLFIYFFIYMSTTPLRRTKKQSFSIVDQLQLTQSFGIKPEDHSSRQYAPEADIFKEQNIEDISQHLPVKPCHYVLSHDSKRHKMPNTVSKFIYPRIILSHLKGKDKFFECSICGHTAKKIRKNQWFSHECKINFIQSNLEKIIFTHQCEQQMIQYKLLVPFLKDNKGNQLKDWIKTRILEQYPSWIKNYMNQRINPQYVNQIKKPLQESIQEGIEMKKELKYHNKELNKEIEQFKLTKQKAKTQGYEKIKTTKQRDEYINYIIFHCQNSLEHHLKGLLTSHVQGWSNFNDKSQQSFIIQQIQKSLYALQFNDQYINWKQQITKIFSLKCTEIEKAFPDPHDHRGRRQLLRYKQAVIFLQNLSTNILQHKRLLIQRLRMESSNLQTCVISFLNKMRKNGYDVPDISYGIIPKNVRRQKTVIKIETIKRHIYRNIGNLELITDLWVMTCVGIRLNDLLRIQFQIYQNKFFDYISLIQQKNKHYTSRVVPRSLKKLLSASQNTYPINLQRLKKLKQFCKENFNGFYKIRASCITTILTGLMKTSGFQPHHVSSTTLKYYVDYENYDLMDKIFDLQNLNIQYHPQCINRSYKRAHFGRIGQVMKEYDCQQTHESEMTLPSQIKQQEENLDDKLRQQLLFNPEIIQLNKEQNNTMCPSKYSLSKLFLNQETLEYFYSILNYSQCSFFKLLASMIQTNIVIYTQDRSAIFHSSSKYIERNQSKSCAAIRKANQILNLEQKAKIKNLNIGPVPLKQFQNPNINRINYSDVSQQQNETIKKFAFRQTVEMVDYDEYQKRRQQKKPNLDNQLLADSSKISKKMHKSQLVLLTQFNSKSQQICVIKSPNIFSKQYPRKSKRLTKLIEQAPARRILTKSQTCKTCYRDYQSTTCQCLKMISICECKQQLICTCSKQKRPTMKQGFLSQSYSVNTQYSIIDTSYNLPQITKSKNNFKKMIEQTGRKYIKQMYSSITLDKILFLPWQTVTKSIDHQLQQVKKNQEYLPLQIKACEVIKKGLGVFSKAYIQQSTIIGGYVGVIRCCDQVNPNDDSLLSIGWLNKSQYFVCCDEASNMGRFFNGVSDREAANCEMKMAFTKNGFYPYFVTTKQIEPEDQIVWYYGDFYPKFQQQFQEQEQ